jgi:transposase
LPIDEIKSAVGIDVGLEKFLTTSDAEAIAVPQFHCKSQAVLARKQRKLARQERGSNNYQAHSRHKNLATLIRYDDGRQQLQGKAAKTIADAILERTGRDYEHCLQ